MRYCAQRSCAPWPPQHKPWSNLWRHWQLNPAPPPPADLHFIAWAGRNRFVEAFGGQRQQACREFDTQSLTGSGAPDYETGDQSHAGMALRWQTGNGWRLHLQAQLHSGTTDSNGYLQASNGSLAPYRARTGNTATQYSLNVGYALNGGNWPAVWPQG